MYNILISFRMEKILMAFKALINTYSGKSYIWRRSKPKLHRWRSKWAFIPFLHTPRSHRWKILQKRENAMKLEDWDIGENGPQTSKFRISETSWRVLSNLPFGARSVSPSQKGGRRLAMKSQSISLAASWPCDSIWLLSWEIKSAIFLPVSLLLAWKRFKICELISCCQVGLAWTTLQWD